LFSCADAVLFEVKDDVAPLPQLGGDRFPVLALELAVDDLTGLVPDVVLER
jgi:hypothetical protein